MKKWYVAGTKTHEEAKALYNLTKQGFNAYLPQYKNSSQKKGMYMKR